MAKKKNINKGALLYNKILKEFSEVNSKLPLERQLSLDQRREYISKKIYPEFKGKSPSRVGKKVINERVIDIFEKVIPKEGCDVNLISPSVIANINWFDLDSYIKEVLPKCIFIRIDAGEYGNTKIFNTLNYNYTRSGVKSIVDNIRDFVSNDTSIDISLTGVKKLKDKKANDGTPENYFIDFILVVNGEAQADIQPVEYKLTKEQKKEATSVKNIILDKVKELGRKKKRKKNANITAKNNLQKAKKLNTRIKQAKSPDYIKKLTDKKIAQYNQAQRQLDNAYEKGNLTDEQYKKYTAQLNQLIFEAKKEGGLI